MGLKADETISLEFEDLLSYLRSKTRIFMDADGGQYYITHTDGYWRVQDCNQLNEKGRFTDCSELVNTLSELIELPWHDGKSIHDLCAGATFYESIQEDETNACVLIIDSPFARQLTLAGFLWQGSLWRE